MTTRLKIISFLLYAFIVTLVLKLGYLQVVKHQHFKDKSERQLVRLVKINPHRGDIYDRNHYPLALSEACYSIYAIPHLIKSEEAFLTKVSARLNIPKKKLRKKIKSHPHFVWLKRQVPVSKYDTLQEADIEGLGYLKEEKRVYPHNALGAHMMGFVGIDNQGLGGLEYKYDTYLKGSPGKLVIEKDLRGNRLISGRRKVFPPSDGRHILTTIDEFIQYRAQLHLEKGIEKMDAERGQVIVMDPQNGDILAMAQIPSFNANKWSQHSDTDRKNSCITDVFEPGSIFKIITLSGVLEEEIVSPKTTLFVPETLKVYNRTINESHKREEGEQDNKSVTEIIVKSLNVGTSLLAEKLGKERFFAYIEQFGFGSTTGVELTGESKGILRPLSAWSGVDTATISFGQGIAVTPLQMATAISAIANGGLLLKPRLVRYITNKEETSLVGIPVVKKRRIISEGTANQVKQIMRKVVDRGTGTTAQIPGYKMAGKTGTAQKAKENGLGYEKGKYVASFIGFFPVYAPKYLILVVVDSPKKSIWGSTVAAPIFKNIAADIIHHYNIPPDHLVKSSLSSSNKIQ